MSEIKYQITPLFSVPVYNSIIDTSESLENLKEENFEIMPSGNGKITKNKNLLNENAYSSLKEQIDNQVDLFIRDVLKVSNDIDFYLTRSWGAQFDKNGYGNSHIHGNSMLSGVCYLQAESGEIMFLKEKGYHNLFTSTFELTYNSYNIYNSESWRFTPSAGSIYIFPSNLTHLVLTNTSDTTRYSIAFNYFVKGKFGIEESLLEI
jgi:uncharacterized protein (TIGR02466 family)